MVDPGTRIYSGHFQVSANYESVRAIFKLFAFALDQTGDEQKKMLDEYYRERDGLGLVMEDDKGARDNRKLDANWIHIVDLGESLDELQIEVFVNESLDSNNRVI